ncbi:MAG: dipeptide epimerase, partial [Alicyclobacillus sp.]|nr:dipeptide epimerase [Alicyclobacillus sp.]
MKLRSYAVNVVELPLRVPFRTALRSTSTVTDIRVTLETEDGITGVGSASPTPAITGDTTGSITAALREHILPALMGVDLEDMEAASTAIQRSIVHNTSAKAAADIAWHDLLARRAAKPLTRWLGGAGNRIVTDATVSLGAVDSMVAQARDLAEEGFRVLKIKLGNHDGLDVERIAAIRSALGQD